jgi:hypothetical protein
LLFAKIVVPDATVVAVTAGIAPIAAVATGGGVIGAVVSVAVAVAVADVVPP